MSRLIDADALKEKYTMVIESYSGGIMERPAVLLETIDNAPTIDAVEVVRCKDCKWLRYCETEDLDLYLACDKPDGGGIPRSEDWFCADGEREGE